MCIRDRITAALKKIHARLNDNAELLKLHLKHYHMNLENFKRRTSALRLPKEIYDKYEKIVKACESCQRFHKAPERSRISGMRAQNFGSLIFVDHVDLSIDGRLYVVLVVVDAASNLIWAGPQKNKEHPETIAAMDECFFEWKIRPYAICGDNYFHEDKFKQYYAYWGIKPIALGPNTPWPNRAEAAVKLFKHYAQIMVDSIKRFADSVPGLKEVTVRKMISRAVEARNTMVTYGGKCPIEIAFGHRPPDVITLENMTPQQIATKPNSVEHTDEVIRWLAIQALSLIHI